MSGITRRKAILGTIGLGTAAVAGCVSDSDDDTSDGAGDDDNGEDDTDNGNDGDAGTQPYFEATIERVGSNCAGPDPGSVYVFEEEGVYTVEGTIPSPTPCYEPVLESTEFEDGTLSLTVDVVAEDIEGECMTCSGKVLYEATIEGVDPDDVERVEVTHEGAETYLIEEAEFGAGRPELVGAEITRTSSDTHDGGKEYHEDSVAVTSFPGPDRDIVEIEGKIATNTPHYEAVLEDAAVQGTELLVAVGVESTMDDDEVGLTVTGLVSYTATIEVRNGEQLSGLTVDHPESSHGIDLDSEHADSAHSGGSETETRRTAGEK